MTKRVSDEDLTFILENTKSSFETLRNDEILITGATGFFGKWLTQTLTAANDHFQAGNRLSLVTRNVSRSLACSPWLAGRNDIHWIESDVRDFKSDFLYSTIIHGAASASRELNEIQPSLMFDTIVDGSRNVLAHAQAGHCKRFLFISSGAVYGTLPESMGPVPEEYLGAPDPLAAQSAYGEAKRAAEFLCSNVANSKNFDLKVARCFAFVGPYLPLNTHFAIGNFLLNVLRGEEMKVQGDGTPLRSYLYAADLIVWLIRILVEGRHNRAYNVGSECSISVSDLAKQVHASGCSFFSERQKMAHPIEIAKRAVEGPTRHVYVPSTERARVELSLSEWTALPVAISKTFRWLLDHSSCDTGKAI